MPWIGWAIAPPETTIVTGPSPDRTDLSYDEEIELPTEPQPAVSIAQRSAARARTRIGESGRAPHPGRPAADTRRGRLRGASGGLLRAVLRHRSAGSALERRPSGLSTRRYPVGLEAVGTRTEQTATATSRSAVSRRFVAATETGLADLLAADLSGLDLVALMMDGVQFGEHTCVVALGIDIDGVEHRLSLVEGSTENATLVTELIVGERGLDVTRPILAVLEGRRRYAAPCWMCSTGL